jgi:hypothetical protein
MAKVRTFDEMGFAVSSIDHNNRMGTEFSQPERTEKMEFKNINC